MDQILKLKDSLMGYLSPAAKRRRSMLPSTPSVKASLMQRPIHPMTEPRNAKQKAIIAGRVSKKYLSPTDTRRFYEGPREWKDNDDYIDEVEDKVDSSSQCSQSPVAPEDSSSQIQCHDEDASATSEPIEDAEESEADSEFALDEEPELDSEAKVHLFLDHQSEFARRQETVSKIREGDWHEDEKVLFQKLSMRGFEPLLPAHWSFDFRTCPETIFSSKERDAFINSKSGNDFRATTALQSLISLGGRVRALKECHKPQEQLIKKEIEHYIKWSEKDGGYASKRFLPLLCIDAGHPNRAHQAIAKSITDKMDFLALRHRQHLTVPPPNQLNDAGEVVIFQRPPPVLYGVIISRCIAIMVTLDAAKLDAKPTTIAHFDFSEKDMDVWNGFALAILVCTVRNHLMAIKDEMESETEEVDSDVDL